MRDRRPQDQYLEIDHPYFDTATEPLTASAGSRSRQSSTVPQLDWRQVLGGALIVIGVTMLVVGWIGISGTRTTYDQLSYFLSGGIGGAAAVIIGATVLVMYEHATDRDAIRLLDERLEALENRLLVKVAALADAQTTVVEAGANGKSSGTVTAGRRRS